jgi:hypothetical protein
VDTLINHIGIDQILDSSECYRSEFAGSSGSNGTFHMLIIDIQI